MISVILPCKDEPYLERLIGSIHDSVLCDHEILVQTEHGLGSAVMCGVRRAKGDVIAVLDADGSHNPQYLSKMVNLVQAYPIIVGSRYIQGGNSRDPIVRRCLSHVFRTTARVLLKPEIKDPLSGFVVAKRQVFTAVNMQPIGYKFALELLVKSNGSFRILEYPIVFEKRKMGKSKTGFKEGIRTIALIFLLWIWKTKHKH